MKNPLLLVIFLWTLTPSYSQIQIKGTVLDRSSKKPIAYANIGILNSPIGSISNGDGSFSLSIPNGYLHNYLTFSAVGFSKWVIPIAEIDTGENYTIYLNQKSTKIREVIVEAKKDKNKNFWLGNKHSDSRLIYTDSVIAGSAVALLIEDKNTGHRDGLAFPVYLNTARLKIARNTMDNFKVRVRILAVDSANNNLPGEDLLQKSIVVTSDIARGWLNFDLSKYNFNVWAPFYLMFEWIMEDKDRLELSKKYKQYLESNPDKVRLDTTQVNGEQAIFYHWGAFDTGTWFGASFGQLAKKNFSCYFRNGLDGWQVAPAVLTARLLVSTQPAAKLTTTSNLSRFKAPVDELMEMPKDEIKEKVITSLSETSQIHINEKIHLHLDKYLYTLGEQIWFKAYVLDGDNHQLLPLSKVLYVELINAQDELVRRYKLPTDNGTARGNILLSDSLQQGRYRIRAYTNQMRNDDPSNFFNKSIQVLAPDSSNMVDIKSISQPNLLVDFFPEGGTFINGIDNNVCFKITDVFGNGIDGELLVSTNMREPIIHTRTTHLGMGKFTLTPVDGVQYFAHVITPIGEIQGLELPERDTKGLRLIINNLAPTKFGINIRANSSQKNVVLIALSGDRVQYMADIPLNNREANFLIPKSSFPNGITKFTVFDDEGIPLAERLAFNKSEKNAQIEISTDKNSYLPRQQIRLKVEVTGYENNPVSGNFSVAITDENQYIQDPKENNIVSNLLLTSELRGKIEHPAYYFETDSLKTLQDLDLVMLTHGWRRFTWNEILTDSIDEPTFEFEEGIAIEGTVSRYLSDKTIESGKLLMVTVSGEPQWVEVEVDSTGHFYMYPLQVYEDTEMVLRASNAKGKSNLSVDLVATDYPEIGKSNNYSTVAFPLEATSENITHRLEESQRRLEIDEAYERIDSITYLEEVVITGKKFQNGIQYSGRNLTVDLSQIPNAHTYFDIFQLLQYRAGIRGLNTNQAKNYKGELVVGNDVLYVIDGYPVDKSQVFNTPTAAIESVNIINGNIAGMFGSSGTERMAIIITRKPKSSRKTGVINLTNVGYSVTREFFSPDYSTPKKEHAKPDFRSTLYWNPEINIDSTGTAEVSFYNADYITNYMVKIEGITDEGIPVTGTMHFESNR